jgi:hypothetical protein
MHCTDDQPPTNDDCGPACPGCPDCSLQHAEYAPAPAAIGAALGIRRCYACDADASGTRDRRLDVERALVPACPRHRDQVAA